MDRMRAIERVHYERWGCEVPMIPLSAAQLINLQSDHAELLDGEQKPIRELCGFFAELLALVVHDPKLSPGQWLEQSSLSELTELGQLAMRVSGIDYEEKKSESSSPSTDSP